MPARESGSMRIAASEIAAQVPVFVCDGRLIVEGTAESLDPLHCSDCRAALAFCERHGWRYDFVPSPSRPLILKSYADNFQRRL